MDELTAVTPVPSAEAASGGPDRRDGRAYVMPSQLALAVNVALATGRPLLLRGEPGSGKSSLASHVAYTNGWRYYEQVVTSRTLTQDLLWSFDPVRRFADAPVHAAAGTELDDHAYVTPGVLWWAFDRRSAIRRGTPAGADVKEAAEPLAELNAGRGESGVVVLIDEIDKADPDLPNGLLVPLGSGEFIVTETGVPVVQQDRSGQPAARLIVITTNGERELPQAFIRRCVVARLTAPDDQGLVAIAREHLLQYEGQCPPHALALAQELATEVVALRAEAKAAGLRAPSTAEYLDALNACRSLGIAVGDDAWTQLRGLTLLKDLDDGEHDDLAG